MDSLLDTYSLTILSFGLIGALSIVQLLVMDVLGILAKHTPGTPVEANHDNRLFRASRAHANTNETLGVFIVVTLFALAVSAPAASLNIWSMVYVLGRLGHMLCYYANLKILRSVCFVISVVAIIVILVLGFSTWM